MKKELHLEVDESKKKESGQLWCPYDGEWTTFNQNGASEFPRCVKCGISTNDFHVKSCNKLWETVDKKKKGKK